MPSVQAMCNAKAGTNLQTQPTATQPGWMGVFADQQGTPAKIVGKLADTDVHDAVGVKCATCHYALSGDYAGRTISGNSTSYAYPGITGVVKADHQVAQGWSTLEKANDVFDGTVTCESCHIDRTHPNWNAIAGHPAPTPTHAGFPAIHMQKIDCRTCHIPKVYSAPGRLLFRDWTAGAYRQTDGSNGNANHFQFAYDFMDGAAVPMIPMKQWIKVQKPSGDEIKIAPGLGSTLPMWYGQGTNNALPSKTRDITAAAALVAAANPGFNIRMNGTNDHPPFQGFQLTDPWKIDSAAKITAMRAELAGTGAGFAAHDSIADARMNLQPFFFDPSHGITEKEAALGSPAAGGCIMCHSTSAINPQTMQPVDPTTYSPKSVGFFDGTLNLAKNGMMIMADYDCGGTDAQYGQGAPGPAGWSNATHPDWMCGMFDAAQMGGNGDGTCDAGELMNCRAYVGMNLFPQFGMPADIGGTMDATGIHPGAFPVDGVNMMQLFAIREGAMTHQPQGCDTRMLFFGIPNGVGPNANGCAADGSDFFSRDEIRAHFKKNLQQVIVGGAKKVFGNMKAGPNFTTYDIGSTCYNPQDGSTFACPDGGYILTTVSEQLMLGYTPQQYAAMTKMFTSTPVASPAPMEARISFMVTGLSIALDGSQSLGSPTGYSWACPGGTLTNGSSAAASCAYATTGSYNVSLTVSGPAGSNTKTVAVNVAAPNQLPTAAGTMTVLNGVATVVDASTDLDGNATLTIFINWGDGTGSWTTAGSSTTHNYNPGVYHAYLSANDARGGNASFDLGVVNAGNLAGTVTGLVATPSSAPLANAIVTLYNAGTAVASAYSNATGHYTLTNVPFATGYHIVTRLGGYLFSDVTGVNVTTQTSVTKDVTSGGATISGTIANCPAQGVAVELLLNGVTVGAVISDSTGAYTFSNVAVGTYSCDPQTTTGHTANTVSVTVATDPSSTPAPVITYN
jgi:PKD repeat protein